jgi:hypothetical protein
MLRIWKQRNLVRVLSNLPQRLIKLLWAEDLQNGASMGRLLKQAGGIGSNINTARGGLTAQFRVNLKLEINEDRPNASTHIAAPPPAPPESHSLPDTT